MRFAVAAVAVAAALVIGAAAYARTTTHGLPQGFRSRTVAVLRSRDFWVLGEYPCAGTWCAALVRSTDGGRHFARVALPWRSAKENIPSLTFVNSRLGYLLGGRLWITHDGGNSWRPSGPKSVREFALAGGDVYVLSKNRFERSPVGRNSWRTVSLPVRYRFVVSLAARVKRVWLLGSTRNIRVGDFALRSFDRGATFRKTHGPCVPGLGGTLVPAGDNVVWAVCPSGMMAGLLLSTNGGWTFPRYRSFHDPGGTSLPILTNAAAIFPSSPRDPSSIEARRGRCTGQPTWVGTGVLYGGRLASNSSSRSISRRAGSGPPSSRRSRTRIGRRSGGRPTAAQPGIPCRFADSSRAFYVRLTMK